MPRVYLGGEELILRSDPAMPPGREGAVFPDPSDPGFVIKLPHTPDDEWREKLRGMLAKPLNTPDVAWPTEAVFSSDRSTIVGCRLPFAAKMHPLAAVYSSDPTTRWVTADYGFRLEVAINLVAAVDKVHNHGCVVGDVSPKNILVGKDASVCLIDTDSFQVASNGRVFRCRVGTPDYTPAELHGPNFSDVDRTVYHDAFGVAAFVFQLLVGPGTHPFTGRHLGTGPPLSLIKRIELGIWPYAKRGHTDYAPRTGSPLDLLHPLLQPLVFQCFEEGHTKPTERPLPHDWLVALTDVRQDTDFVRVLAPQLEAKSQRRQRQAILAASGTQSRHPAAPRAFAKVATALPRRLTRTVVFAVAAGFLVLAAGLGVYCGMSGSPRIDFATKAQQPFPTPALYKRISKEMQDRPRPSADQPSPLPTPAIYHDIADTYR